MMVLPRGSIVEGCRQVEVEASFPSPLFWGSALTMGAHAAKAFRDRRRVSDTETGNCLRAQERH